MTGTRVAVVAVSVSALLKLTGCGGGPDASAAPEPEAAAERAASEEPEPAPEPEKTPKPDKTPEPDKKKPKPVDPYDKYEAALDQHHDAYVAALVDAYPGWRDDTGDGVSTCVAAELAGGEINMDSAAGMP